MQAELENVGNLEENIFIQTKSYNYKIPVSARILTSEEFDKLNEQSINKYGTKLDVFAKVYTKEYPNIPVKITSQDIIDTFKYKNMANPFETANVSKYFEKFFF